MHILRNLGLVLFAFFSLHASAAWNDNEVKQIEQRIQLPTIKAQKFVITAFGAKTSASAKVNQDAINRAIATASKKGGGEVIVPKGTWNTGAIRLQSHVNLVISDGATLKLPSTRSSIPRQDLLGRYGLLELQSMHLRLSRYRRGADRYRYRRWKRKQRYMVALER